MTNVTQIREHPKIVVETIQNDLNDLTSYLDDELQNDLTSDELYDMIERMKRNLDELKSYTGE